VQTVSNDNFGPLVAYLVPGATVLLGLRPYFPVLQSWFASTPPDAPTIGSFLYLTVASLAAGMTISAIRWIIIDHLHAATGLKPPNLDFSKLADRVEGFSLLIEIHYRHFLYYSNMAVAIAIGYAAYRFSGEAPPIGWFDAGILTLEIVFYWTSRDTMAKYLRRSQQLLGTSASAR
jgi:hypothetical protein